MVLFYYSSQDTCRPQAAAEWPWQLYTCDNLSFFSNLLSYILIFDLTQTAHCVKNPESTTDLVLTVALMTVIFAPVWYLIGTFQQNFYSFALLYYVNFWCLWFSLQSFIHNWSWPAGFGQTYLFTKIKIERLSRPWKWNIWEKEIWAFELLPNVEGAGT